MSPGGFAHAMKDGRAFVVLDKQVVLVKVCPTTIITQFPRLKRLCVMPGMICPVQACSVGIIGKPS